MSDDVFRQTRKKVTAADLGNTGDEHPFETIHSVQQAVAKETGKEVAKPFENPPFQISGNIPPQFQQALAQRAMGANPAVHAASEDEGFDTFEAPPDRPRVAKVSKSVPTPDAMVRPTSSDALDNLLQQLNGMHQWEEFTFPSKGKFYETVPALVHVRAMTGEEEQILATPRYVKRGKAIDMIFRRCIKENINTEELLSADRTHLLIFLRGISYTPEYDVEIKCPNCSMKFAHVIDLNEMNVESCPDSFGPESLSGVLPVSKFKYRYRLATGQDEQEISNYREKRIQQWGGQSEDDTLLYRTALLLDEIQGVSMKRELAMLLKKLPIQDVGHLRNEINTPPFGVDTEIPILCPSCSEEFKLDLPLEANFFFPRKKAEKIQA